MGKIYNIQGKMTVSKVNALSLRVDHVNTASFKLYCIGKSVFDKQNDCYHIVNT